MTDKNEKQAKGKPVRFALPLDATDDDLQTVIDALKLYAAEAKAKKENQTPETKED
ncbi:MAG: hypothetical protein MUO40_08335 [Anaerolineaceae bacterium]|nr:hypothetical protein [Anaerolineaceae bacterium]